MRSYRLDLGCSEWKSSAVVAIGLALLVGGCGQSQSATQNTTPDTAIDDAPVIVDSSDPTDTATPPVDTGAPPADAPPSADVHFVVYGDSRSNVAPHQSVVDAFAKKNPQLVIATGDLWDGYGPAQWKTIVTKNANIGDLLAKNLFLVSRGNHETVAEVRAFSPPLLRNDAELYSFTFGNSFFVSLGMDPSTSAAYLKTQLSSAAATAATWRFVYSHYPIYSAGPHGGTGDAAIEALCDQYRVTAYFTGHDHLYERSQQMKAQKVVDTGDALVAGKGVVYVVTGGGGAPLYTTGKIASTHFTRSTLHFLDVTATGSLVTVKAIKPDGTQIDSFSIAN